MSDITGTAIDIELNGARATTAAGATVASLLASLGISTPGIAVAVNGRVVRASEHASHELRRGDAIEVVRAASGG